MLDEIVKQLREDGFDFVPVVDGAYHKFKSPFTGWYAGSKWNTGLIVTVQSWDESFKKVYKQFNENVNGELHEAEEFVKAKTQEAEKQKKASNEAAKLIAQEVWASSIEGNAERCPYLARKGLKSLFGARVDADSAATVKIPCVDSEGTIWGIQSIAPSGDKKFLKGQRKESTFFQIGEIHPNSTIIISEGFATAASIYQATKHPTITAWDAGNLKRVAEIFRKKYSNKILIAGDNDQSLTGQKAAENAAKAVNGLFIYPETVNKDWNDCLVEKGEEFLKTIINKKLETITNDRNKLQRITLKDLLTKPLPEYEWLVKDLLIKGGTSSLSGPPKSGKSTLSRKIALSVARGEEFFGRKARKGSVYYIAVEEKMHQVKEHFQLLKVSPDEDIELHCAYTPTNLAEQLRKVLSEKRFDLVVLDTLAKTTGISDLNDMVKVNEGLQPFHDIAKDFDTHILFVHHMNKGKEGGAESMAGSVAIRGAFDCNMLLEREGKKVVKRIFSSEQRYGEDFEAHVVEFDKGTKDPKLGLKAGQEKVASKLLEIVQLLREEGEDISSSALLRELGGNKNIFRAALKQGVKNNWIIETKSGKQKKTYRVTETAPAKEEDQF